MDVNASLESRLQFKNTTWVCIDSPCEGVGILIGYMQVQILSYPPYEYRY